MDIKFEVYIRNFDETNIMVVNYSFVTDNFHLMLKDLNDAFLK